MTEYFRTDDADPDVTTLSLDQLKLLMDNEYPIIEGMIIGLLLRSPVDDSEVILPAYVAHMETGDNAPLAKVIMWARWMTGEVNAGIPCDVIPNRYVTPPSDEQVAFVARAVKEGVSRGDLQFKGLYICPDLYKNGDAEMTVTTIKNMSAVLDDVGADIGAGNDTIKMLNRLNLIKQLHDVGKQIKEEKDMLAKFKLLQQANALIDKLGLQRVKASPLAAATTEPPVANTTIAPETTTLLGGQAQDNEMTLWGRRNSVARGDYWEAERKVTEQTAQEWLKVFRNEEPGVTFIVSKRKPSDKMGKFNQEAAYGDPQAAVATVKLSKKLRQANNDQAVALMRELEASGAETVTEEQKEILRKYSGTGGALIGADGLKGSPFEYYTPKPVAQAMWDVLAEYGIKEGKFLDPSSGTGVFVETAPKGSGVLMDAVELSPISGRINQLVNSEANVKIASFEEASANMPDGSYDAIITNVPFGGTNSVALREFAHKDPEFNDMPMEGYFLLKSLKKLRHGGMAMFITPPRCVSGKGATDSLVRLKCSLMAEFVGAFRLPNSVFAGSYADTIVDVMLWRKFSKDGMDAVKASYATMPSLLYDCGVLNQEFLDGKYFIGSGHKYVFGTEENFTNRYGKQSVRIVNDASLGDILKMMRKFPESDINWELLNASAPELPGYADGDTVFRDGAQYRYEDGSFNLVAAERTDDAALSATGVRLATAYDALNAGCAFKDAMAYLDAMISRGRRSDVAEWLQESQGITANEDSVWHAYLEGRSIQQALAEHDPPYPYNDAYPAIAASILSTAQYNGGMSGIPETVAGALQMRKQIYQSGAFTDLWLGNTQAQVANITVNTPDAQYERLRYAAKGKIPLDDFVKATGIDPMKSREWVVIDGIVMRDHEFYVGKYADIKARIQRSLEQETDESKIAKLRDMLALCEEKVVKIDASKITFNLHSPFLSSSDKIWFLRDMVSDKFKLQKSKDGRESYIYDSKENTEETRKMKRIAYFLNYGTLSTGGKNDDSILEADRVEALLDEVRRMNVKLNAWAKANPVVGRNVNERVNRVSSLKFGKEGYSQDPVHIPGMNPDIELRPFQNKGVRRFSSDFSGILGFGVGLGKTYTALATVQNVQSMGIKKKTMFVVPPSVLSNWRNEVSKAYSTMDDCLFVGLRDVSNGRKKYFSSKAAEDLMLVRENKHAKIFVTFETFSALKLKPETVEKYKEYLSEIDNSPLSLDDWAETNGGGEESANPDLDQDRGGVAYDDEVGSKTEQIAKASKLNRMEVGKGRKGFPFLEDLGIDSIVIDEAHAYKNAVTANTTKSQVKAGVKNLSLAKASDRGADGLAKAWYIRSLGSGGDGVMMLTATPVTNSPQEIYSMMSLAIGEREFCNLSSVSGNKEFLSAICTIESREELNIIGELKIKPTFVGLSCLEMLRKSINQVSLIENENTVPQMKDLMPDTDSICSRIQLDEATITTLNKLKNSYKFANKMVQQDANMFLPDPALEGCRSGMSEVSVGLLSHPFNIIRKMERANLDDDLYRDQVTFIVPEGTDTTALVEEFNALNLIEDRERITFNMSADAIVETTKVYKDKMSDKVKTRLTASDDPADFIELNKYKVRAEAFCDEPNKIVVDSTEQETQRAFIAILDKHGVAPDVPISPKLAFFLENFKKEAATPKSRGTPPIAKQLVFCDYLALHNKLKIALTSKAGVPSNKITIVNGETVEDPMELQDIQDGFNADDTDEEENVYSVIIANKKAEVGINLQKGSQAVHHITFGWTPDSLIQRNGRVARQGNYVDRVTVYRYEADGTFDSYKSGLVNAKGNWIDGLLNRDDETVEIGGGISPEEQQRMIAMGGSDQAEIDKILEQTRLDKEKEKHAEARKKQIDYLSIITKGKNLIRKYDSAKQYYREAVDKVEDEIRESPLSFLSTRIEKLSAVDSRTEETAAKRQAELAGLNARFKNIQKKLEGKVRRLCEASGDEKLLEVFKNCTDYSTIYLNTYIDKAAETSEIYQEWRELVDSNAAMIETATNAMTEISKTGYGESAEVVAAMIDGKTLQIKGMVLTNGRVVRAEGKLWMFEKEYNRFVTDSTTASWDRMVGAIEIIPDGTPECTAAYEWFAAYEDERAIKGKGKESSIFSSISPAVALLRKEAVRVKMRANDLLFAESFPFWLVDRVEGSQALMDAYDYQHSLMEEADNYDVILKPGAEGAITRRTTSADRDVCSAIVKYLIKVQGAVVLDDAVKGFSASMFGKMRFGVLTAQKFLSHVTLEGKDSGALDLFAPCPEIDEFRQATSAAEEAAEKEKVDRLANVTHVAIYGDTRPHKEEIKQTAKEKGGGYARFGSVGSEFAWIIPYKAYLWMVEHKPSWFNDIKVELDPMNYKVSGR